METRRNVNINSVEIIWICARSCKTPSWEHHTARMFIRKFSSSQHRHRTNVGKPWHKEASYPFHRKGSLLLPQPKPANDVSASLMSEWRAQAMFTSRFSPPLPFISLSFLLCSTFPEKVLDALRFTRNPSSAGHRKRDVAVKYM